MNKEQPIDILSSNVSEESVIECAEDRTMGSLDKFKDVKSLEEAYVNLQSEFTRKCQKLSELEKENSRIKESANVLEPCFEKPDWQMQIQTFLSENPSAKNYATEIMEVLMQDKVLASQPNSLNLAFNQVKAGLYKSNEELTSDPDFLEKYVLSNPKITDMVINKYLSSLRKNQSPQLINTSKTGSVSLTPQTKPANLLEARMMAEKLFKK